jgi:transcription antitermination protein NusB
VKAGIMTRHQLRIQLVTYLYQHLLLDKSIANIIVDEALREGTEESDYLLNNLYNLIENEAMYAQFIQEHLSEEWNYERILALDRAILLAAISEFALDEAARSIIINEAVEIAKVYSNEDSYAFINAVLDHL